MDEIKGIARVKFHPGKVEEWKRLTEQAIWRTPMLRSWNGAAVRKPTGRELAVPIYRGCEVTGFAQDATGLDVALSGHQPLRPEYLGGATAAAA